MVKTDDTIDYQPPKDVLAEGFGDYLLEGSFLIYLFVGKDDKYGVEENKPKHRGIKIFFIIQDAFNEKRQRKGKGQGDTEVTPKRVKHWVFKFGFSHACMSRHKGRY